MTQRILIVDDEPDIRDMLKTLMETEGYAVGTASNGLDALEAFQAEPCDVVLTDIKMPGMTGLQLLRRVKAIDKSVEVIMLTGHGTVESAVEGLKQGAFDYLLKPCDMDTLLKKVTEAASRKRAQENKIIEARMKDITSRRI